MMLKRIRALNQIFVSAHELLVRTRYNQTRELIPAPFGLITAITASKILHVLFISFPTVTHKLGSN